MTYDIVQVNSDVRQEQEERVQQMRASAHSFAKSQQSEMLKSNYDAVKNTLEVSTPETPKDQERQMMSKAERQKQA